ncbi:XdhC family protein [Methylotuvimicrobium alcaliphilum]|uniref:Dehydrogenase molybdenum attachment maturation factor n=1 Tax=Methylotuvimicrobium alcaliphilum (strain DSM 19304 / NCIMB 14124 / VKM B-2133 / 20Z) TaxID=1091494 RepID=G4T2F8_META2|nr:XdhC/CoxI family protein [Methylotuvimicrobium alcaliphilum]CCE23888.1 putative dehydrogenase molybdenum attachment maturation factor [Methylotuvimicrobium alcaliphilum 20Z]
MTRNTHHLIDAYWRLRNNTENVVLATIIETFGSTYQKAGARMLIAGNGESSGLLGGGCFERDLIEQAHTVFETENPKTLFYDMRSPDDAVWGLGLGCNGAVRVLLQLLKANSDFHPLNRIVDASESHTAGILATIYESDHPDYSIGDSYFLTESELDGLSQQGNTPESVVEWAKQTWMQHKACLKTCEIDRHTVKLFFDLIRPPAQLLVLGAGVDTLPVVQFAKALGWRVTIVDHRPGYVKPERFPAVDALLHLMPEDLQERLSLDRFDALVLMTHSIEYDERYLRVIASSRIPFIGLLGPVHRRDRLLDSLGADAPKIAAKVFGPVGLDIGAETPEEIALSIMAGIHAAMKGRTGGQLGI